MSAWRITDLNERDIAAIKQTAALILDVFRETSPSWLHDMEAALKEVRASFSGDRISRVAIDEEGNVVGWAGSIKRDGYVWELHPLAVRRDQQHQGIGSALVADMESLVSEHGALTLWLGTDDETNQTSLGGVDLYPNVLEHLVNIRNLHGHPFEFYKRLGFVIVGVMPDANGWGKPGICLAKRVAR